MWVNQMQEAFVRSAVAVAQTPSQVAGRYVDRVIRVADKQRPKPPKESVKLSFRTAQKLKAQGVI